MDRATRGLWLSLCGLALVPVTLLAVAVVPDRGRLLAFILGLSAVAAVAVRGGWIAQRAFATGREHRGRGFAGAVLGLGLGLTAGMVALWSTLGFAVG